MLSKTKNVRKLATVRKISKISPIDGADRIELAHIDGWRVVVAKGVHKAGDRVVYCEIDSAIPLNDILDHSGDLRKRGTKTYKENDYHILKTIRLRGEISQGLILPPRVLRYGLFTGLMLRFLDGKDVSARLDIIKYDREEWLNKGPAGNRKQPADANIIGPFPAQFARKTDSERVQNLTKFMKEISDHSWVVTEKIDGQSITLINDGGRIRVATRNYEVQDHPAKRWAEENGFLESVPDGYAIQGEWAGPGVQGNKLKLKGSRLYVFDVQKGGEPVKNYDIVFADHWAVPRLGFISKSASVPKVSRFLDMADGLKSTINPDVQAEGIVFHEANGTPLKCLGFRATFKAINNQWLLKNE